MLALVKTLLGVLHYLWFLLWCHSRFRRWCLQVRRTITVCLFFLRFQRAIMRRILRGLLRRALLRYRLYLRWKARLWRAVMWRAFRNWFRWAAMRHRLSMWRGDQLRRTKQPLYRAHKLLPGTGSQLYSLMKNLLRMQWVDQGRARTARDAPRTRYHGDVVRRFLRWQLGWQLGWQLR